MHAASLARIVQGFVLQELFMDRPHFRFWPKRLPRAITVPATSLWDNLEVNARRYPDKVALVFFGQVLTYRELLQKAERLAACLRGLGVE